MKHNIPVYTRFQYFIMIFALLDIMPKPIFKSTVLGMQYYSKLYC